MIPFFAPGLNQSSIDDNVCRTPRSTLGEPDVASPAVVFAGELSAGGVETVGAVSAFAKPTVRDKSANAREGSDVRKLIGLLRGIEGSARSRRARSCGA
jgi:hypothetical protein